MNSDPIFAEESEHLAKTRSRYEEIAGENEEYFAALPSLYPNESEIIMLGELMTNTHNRIIRLRQGMERPYFARIDFMEKDCAGDKFYLGKIGVMDSGDNIVTLDWRAPIATLYYDSNVGDVAYDAPGGPVSGRLSLKRQLEIEKGELVSWADVDTVSNDGLLRPYLGVNADDRLKTIIATIQAEQNRIIREELNINLIVQGVAGSGKTTVALHRVAYLVYNYRDTVKPGQFLVIGPNRFFISYISSVLPDLDVDSVPQYTYAELAREIIGEDFQVADPAYKLAAVLEGEALGEVDSYKASMRYKETIDRFLPWYEDSLRPKGDFYIRGFPVLTAPEIKEAWDSAQAGLGSTTRARVEQCIIYLQSGLQSRKLEFEMRLSSHFKPLYQDQNADLNRIQRDRAYIQRELDLLCGKSLRAFFGKLDAKLLSVYRMFIQNCEMFLDEGFDEIAAAALKKRSLSAIRSRRPDPEDIPALLYLGSCINGIGRLNGLRHAVIDEAQDFGEFDFFALQRVLGGCTFTVVGDLAQSIYTYRGVTDWGSVASRCFERRAELCEMLKSYRTTVEIMEAANLVTAQLGLNPAVPVIRHGRKVALYDATSKESREKIAELVKGYLAEGLKSIALLAKTAAALKPVVAYLEDRGIAVEAADIGSEKYSGGVCAMPGYLSKGLEFDAVILCDGSDGVYRKDRRADMHLLYVEMTRALHKLDIFYDGWITEPLTPLLKS